MTVKAWKYMVKKIADKGKPMFFKNLKRRGENLKQQWFIRIKRRNI